MESAEVVGVEADDDQRSLPLPPAKTISHGVSGMAIASPPQPWRHESSICEREAVDHKPVPQASVDVVDTART